ncbi:MAG: energy transducer TonB [Sphingobium sp.]|nr:energy transducer TonB [Sphingobium sp.]
MTKAKTISTGSLKASATAALILGMGATLGFSGNAMAQESTTTDTTAFRQQVERNIDKTLSLSAVQNSRQRAIATVAVTIAADGSVRNAHLVRTTGVTRFDREALRTAQTVSYPATGKTRTVAMVLGFNQPVTAENQQEGQRLVLAWRGDQRVMLATTSAAHQPDS